MSQQPVSITKNHGLLRLTSSKPCHYKTGREHTLLGDRISILTVDLIALAGITHDQARLLGHKGTAAFKRTWVTNRDARWLEREDRSDRDILERFASNWGQRTAWFVTYKQADAARFLAAAGRGDIDHVGNADYTANPARAIDDLEVIDTATQARYSKDALSFCIGRQVNRQKEADAERDRKRRIAHPAPWWEAAA